MMTDYISVPLELPTEAGLYPILVDLDFERGTVSVAPNLTYPDGKIPINSFRIDLNTGAVLSQELHWASYRIDTIALANLRKLLLLPPIDPELLQHIEQMDLPKDEFLRRYPITATTELTSELHQSLRGLPAYPRESEPIEVS